MSEARRAVKESMLVAADQYEADGDALRARMLRLLVVGSIQSLEVRGVRNGPNTVELVLDLSADPAEVFKP